MCFLKESYEKKKQSYEKMQKIQILKILERPLFKIREYAFNFTNMM